MNTTDQNESSQNSEAQGQPKRAYRKPVVQIYGTLKNLTQGSFAPGTHVQDNAPPFPVLPPFNRT